MRYVIKKSEAKIVQEENSQFSEYPFPFRDVSLGVTQINGRYPQNGFSVDQEVEAYWYVESGKGTVWIDGQAYVIESGDMISIPKGEKYWIHGEELKLIVCGSPRWYPEQHKHSEK